MAQDDYYYEIQLTNKQLVFYFMAGATGLILSFLAGVMVGRGVDAASGEVLAARPVREERIVPEEPPKVAEATPVEELTYAQRLESDRSDESLERSRPAVKEPASPAKGPAAREPAPKGVKAPAVKEPAARPIPAPVQQTPKAGATETAATGGPAVGEAPGPTPVKPTAPPAAKATPASRPIPAGTFSIQVGAFKDRASAESVVTRLEAKGFAAFVVIPEGAEGLFNVRVGTFAARTDAERVQGKLRDQEKFKPFIVKN
ncbi:MAG: SPOR domain-containing protein [Acidobacteria bacterium]|nr:SPOR domain-containing protein [Acidobacteriota bacterium]